MGIKVDRAELGTYTDFDAAERRALVCLAMDAPYWLVEEDGCYRLMVRAGDEARLRPELEAFEEEERRRPDRAPRDVRVSPRSLFIFVAVMTAAFLWQARNPDLWIDLGGTSRLTTIEQGEWWRAFTALFLHGDIAHLGSNLFFGAIFAYATLRRLKPFRAWSAILLAGGLGNFVNSALSQNPSIMSIGASTGVFAALGVLSACRAWDAVGRSFRANARRMLVPLGGGLGLLAVYGSAPLSAVGQPIDYTAHLFGFLAGLVTGTAVWWELRAKKSLAAARPRPTRQIPPTAP